MKSSCRPPKAPPRQRRRTVALRAVLVALAAARPAFAAAFVAWNPVVALHLAGGGHNDAWVAALVMGALALAATGRRQLAGAAWRSRSS